MIQIRRRDFSGRAIGFPSTQEDRVFLYASGSGYRCDLGFLGSVSEEEPGASLSAYSIGASRNLRSLIVGVYGKYRLPLEEPKSAVSRDERNALLEASSSSTVSPLRVPLWIGAIGHRALRPQDEPRLRETVRCVLEEIESRWAREFEPCLLSSLAEGSDQLVAEEALSRGWKLVVPLPLPLEDYETDFETPEAQVRFRRLLSRAKQTYWVGLETGTQPDQVSRSGAARNLQYARAGREIASASAILVALWDGEDRGLVGGTSDTILRVLEGPRDASSGPALLDAPPPRLVYHVWTPRTDHPDTVGIPFRIDRLTPEIWSARKADLAAERTPRGADAPGSWPGRRPVFEELMERLVEFEFDARELAKKDAGAAATSSRALLPDREMAAIPPPLEATLLWYGVADALAIRFQRQARPALPFFLVLAFVALVGFELHSHLAPHRVWGLLLFFVAFLLAFAAHRYFGQRAIQRKYLDYRALAEGLRVQFFWRLCGISESVSEHYLRRHRGELSWIPAAISAMSVGTTCPDPKTWGDTWPLGRRRRLAREQWIRDQYQFFKQKTAAVETTGKQLRRRAVVLFWIASALGGALLVFTPEFKDVFASAHVYTDQIEFLKKPGFITLALLLGGSAALRHFAEHRAFEAIARRYELMRTLFARGLAATGEDRASLESDAAGEVFRELGREALAENGDWLLLHRDRPLEVPTLV